MDLKPHQQRAVQEAAELGERIIKLTAFLDGNDLFWSLSATERTLLRQQYNAMLLYQQALKARIELWATQTDPVQPG